jgi:hypothetical protein
MEQFIISSFPFVDLGHRIEVGQVSNLSFQVEILAFFMTGWKPVLLAHFSILRDSESNVNCELRGKDYRIPQMNVRILAFWISIPILKGGSANNSC